MNKEQTIEEKMRTKGYQYRLTPMSGAFPPLYFKRLAEIGPILRTQYPNERFYTKKLPI